MNLELTQTGIRQLRGNDKRRIFAVFYEVGYPDDSTTRSRARLTLHSVSRVRCNLAVSIIHIGANTFLLVTMVRAIKDKNAVVLLERRRNQRQLQPHLQHGSEHHMQC